MGIAETIAVSPRTMAMLAILEPIALPTARLPASSIAAVADTMSSGADVPIESLSFDPETNAMTLTLPVLPEGYLHPRLYGLRSAVSL